jgi:hypothetical protein
MENIKLIFCDENSSSELQAYVNDNNQLYLEIDMNESYIEPNFICLNYETALMLVHTIQRELLFLNKEI